MLSSKPLPLSEHMPLFKSNTLTATVGTYRPFNGGGGCFGRAFGVATVLKDDYRAVCIIAAGYAKSDDMARAWPLLQIIEHLRQGQHLVAYCRGFETLKHVRDRRLNGDLSRSKTNKKPIKGSELLVPLEQAQMDGKWLQKNFGKDDAPQDLRHANNFAEAAYRDSSPIDFANSNTEHLDCWITECGIKEFPEAVTVGAL